MKKLLFTALAVIAFSGVSMANVIEAKEVKSEDKNKEDSILVNVNGESPWDCLNVFMSSYSGYCQILEYSDDNMALELAREDYDDCRYGGDYGLC